MKRRIELNKKKKGLLYFIKALKKRGFHPEHVKVGNLGKFKISEAIKEGVVISDEAKEYILQIIKIKLW